MSREMQCKAMINCLETKFPCSSTMNTNNCYVDCRNMAGVSSPTETCVNRLLDAASCP
jgi:hypothetical protein